jgi:uncharacterized protein YrrD
LQLRLCWQTLSSWGKQEVDAQSEKQIEAQQPERAMLQSIKKLDDYRIVATTGEGEAGKVEEVYFDDEQCVVRYLVVDTGGWLGGRSVLVSPYAARSIDWSHRAIFVNLTRDQVEGTPGIDTHKVVSRQQEAEYHRFYGYPPYWQSGKLWAWGAMPVISPTDSQIREEEEAFRRMSARRAGADAHLRSSKVVLGYRIEASDDSIGHVSDFLFDEKTWAVRYLIVDTRNWLHGKHVLVSPLWIRDVRWSDRTLSVTLTRRQIEQSPEYDSEHAPSLEYEIALHGHYSRPHYRE